MFRKKSKQVLGIVMDHFALVKECYGCLDKFIERYFDGAPEPELLELHAQIDTVEHTADEIRKDLITEFLDGSMLPQTRKEVLTITGMVDKIADKSQSVAEQLILEKISVPEELRPNVRKMISTTAEEIELLEECIGLLFDNYDVLIRDRTKLHNVSVKEHEVDVIETVTDHLIYSTDWELIEKHVLKHFITKLCDISDLVEDISDQVLEMVVLRKV